MNTVERIPRNVHVSLRRGCIFVKSVDMNYSRRMFRMTNICMSVRGVDTSVMLWGDRLDKA